MKVVFILVILLLIVYFLFKQKKKTQKESGFKGRVICYDFTIGKNIPKDENAIVEFISVNKDGTATIKTLRTGEVLTAKPKLYFVGKDFGAYGLELVSISNEKQEICLHHTMPEYIDNE